MPEGPSILYLKDQLMPFKGKLVKEAGGYGDMSTDWIKGKKLTDIKTWGNDSFQVYQQEYAADGSEVTMKCHPNQNERYFSASTDRNYINNSNKLKVLY